MNDLPRLDDVVPPTLRAVLGLHGFDVHVNHNGQYFEVTRGATHAAFYVRRSGEWRFYADYAMTSESAADVMAYRIRSTREFVRLLTGVDV